MSRARFELEVGRFGVTSVRNGTLDDTVAQIDGFTGGQGGAEYRNQVNAGTVLWQDYNPGSTSLVYDGVLQGLEDFASGIGGIPPINNIVFVRYLVNANSRTTPATGGGTPTTTWTFTNSTGTLARHDGNTMFVYLPVEWLARSAEQLPTARDTAAGAAPVDTPDQKSAIGRVITHELGHGLQDVIFNQRTAADARATAQAQASGQPAPAPSPNMLDEYERAVGWWHPRGTSGLLFDIQTPGVAAAIRGSTAPAFPPIIDPANPPTLPAGVPAGVAWNGGTIGEQPLSSYMVTGGPGEDFAEAVTAFVHAPQVLLSRSPARHAFIQRVVNEARGLRRPNLLIPRPGQPSGLDDRGLLTR